MFTQGARREGGNSGTVAWHGGVGGGGFTIRAETRAGARDGARSVETRSSGTQPLHAHTHTPYWLYDCHVCAACGLKL